MSVTDRGYRPWTGDTTPYLQRVLVIPRFALAQVLKTKFIRLAYTLCFTPCFFFAIAVYVAANMETIQTMLGVSGELPELSIGPEIYGNFLGWLLFPVMAMTLIAGPPLIALDLANGAVPLYLSKALRTRDYIAGKALVLLTLLSTCSWMPIFAVYLLQYGLADETWRSENLWLGGSIVLVGLSVVSILTALSLAVSAHVKRIRLARIALLLLLFGSSGVAGVVNKAGHTETGSFLSPVVLVGVVTEWGFTPPARREARRLAEARSQEWTADPRGHAFQAVEPLGVPLALLGLAGWLGLALWTVGRKIRPVEVVG